MAMQACLGVFRTSTEVLCCALVLPAKMTFHTWPLASSNKYDLPTVREAEPGRVS